MFFIHGYFAFNNVLNSSFRKSNANRFEFNNDCTRLALTSPSVAAEFLHFQPLIHFRLLASSWRDGCYKSLCRTSLCEGQLLSFFTPIILKSSVSFPLHTCYRNTCNVSIPALNGRGRIKRRLEFIVILKRNTWHLFDYPKHFSP